MKRKCEAAIEGINLRKIALKTLTKTLKEAKDQWWQKEASLALSTLVGDLRNEVSQAFKKLSKGTFSLPPKVSAPVPMSNLKLEDLEGRVQ